MSTLHSSMVEPSARHVLTTLFAEHKYLRTVIGAILEAGMGTAVTDNPANPNAASLYLEFNFLGGDAAHPAAAELVRNLKGTAVVPNNQWRDLLYQIHGERLKTHQRYACDHTQLHLAHLQPFVSSIAPEFTIKQLDVALAQQIRRDVTPDLVDNFGSAKAFIAQGFGFCALHVPTGQIACGASTFAVCGSDIEIEIDTHPHYQRRGLATAVAAALIIHCLQNNITPHWDAHNPTSARLAQRLGYQMLGTYDTYYIPDG